MTDQPATTRELVAQAASAIWSNRFARALLLILLAFEIYNTAILPAIQGTYSLEKLKAEAASAEANAKADTAIVKGVPGPTVEQNGYRQPDTQKNLTELQQTQTNLPLLSAAIYIIISTIFFGAIGWGGRHYSFFIPVCFIASITLLRIILHRLDVLSLGEPPIEIIAFVYSTLTAAAGRVIGRYFDRPAPAKAIP